jgi:hypothetical protein
MRPPLLPSPTRERLQERRDGEPLAGARLEVEAPARLLDPLAHAGEPVPGDDDRAEIDVRQAPKFAHHVAHLGQEYVRQIFRAIDRIASAVRRLGVKLDRGEPMSEHVVEIARDPRPLGNAPAPRSRPSAR